VAEPADVGAALQAMARDFAAGVPQRLQALEAAHQAFMAAWSVAPSSAGQALGELQRLAHSLKGAARIFGLPLTADAARDLEAACEAVSSTADGANWDTGVIVVQLQALSAVARAEAGATSGLGA
jgi:chemotaxis protein histidine kinase CheA